MELVSTMEINGEEREIADAFARGQIAANAQNIATNAEGIAGLNNNLGVIGKCKNLLNTTLQTTTQNGVTCTNNGDGTYTLNGTATANAEFEFFNGLGDYQHLKGKRIRVVGCPSGGSIDTYHTMLQLQKSPWTYVRDTGSGGNVTINDDNYWIYWIRIVKDATVENLVFKPMLINLDDHPELADITYDDFVPYTGDGETLTEDVASLKSDLSECRKKSDITTNETLIGTFNGKNYYRRLFTGIGASGSSVTVNVGEKIEIYNYYGRAYTYGQSGASNVKYPIPNNNYYIESQNSGETSFQLTIPTSSDTRKVDLVIEYTKVDE